MHASRPVEDPATRKSQTAPRDIERRDIDHRFAFHPASSEEKQAAHGTVRQITGDAARQLTELLPPGREKSLCITHLEEAMMWGNAALARATANQADAGLRQHREGGNGHDQELERHG